MPAEETPTQIQSRSRMRPGIVAWRADSDRSSQLSTVGIKQLHDLLS
jgi:hypothetical protein